MTVLLSGLEEPLPPIPEQVSEADIEPWRAHIDQIDLLLLHLMNIRARSANNIGFIKNQLHLPIYAPRREQEVLDNVISANEGPLSSQAVQRLFERLIDETRSLERQTYQDETALTALLDRLTAKRTLWATLISLFCLFTLGGGALTYLVESENSLDFDGVRLVSIPPSSDLESIMDSLQSSGILSARWSFRYLARLTGWGSQIKAGQYEFASGVSNRDMLATLRAGLQVQVRVTIPAGSRPQQIAESVARNMAFDADEYLAALYSEELASELGTDTLHLFAYMLPDTYFFYWLTEPEDVIRRMKTTADEVIAGAASQAESHVLESHDELVNLAAIVEWETSVVEEKARVAGVYVNRLKRNWPLQADPTVQLAILASEGSKRRLRYSDYAVEHPYNTYLFTGLPPGPITNPTASSLRAAAAPEEHAYFFFVASPEGGHAFNSTLIDHNRDAAAFRRHLRRNRQPTTLEGS